MKESRKVTAWHVFLFSCNKLLSRTSVGLCSKITSKMFSMTCGMMYIIQNSSVRKGKYWILRASRAHKRYIRYGNTVELRSILANWKWQTNYMPNNFCKNLWINSVMQSVVENLKKHVGESPFIEYSFPGVDGKEN